MSTFKAFGREYTPTLTAYSFEELPEESRGEMLKPYLESGVVVETKAEGKKGKPKT
jgi:hypothetical protein